MEQQVTNQEILLITGSGFYNRQYYKRADGDTNTSLSSMEELEKACWDGMLHEMLPELVGNNPAQATSFIWNTASGMNFLCVNISSYPVPVDKKTSIDPYYFLGASNNNN